MTTEYFTTIRIVLQKLHPVKFKIHNIQMPTISGPSVFHLTTYEGDPVAHKRRDESEFVHAFPVLKAVTVLLTSEVVPNVYRQMNANITFWMKVTSKVEKDEHLVLVAPPNYVVRDGSFQPILGISSA